MKKIIILALAAVFLLACVPQVSHASFFSPWMKNFFKNKVNENSLEYKSTGMTSECNEDKGECGLTATQNTNDPADKDVVTGEASFYPMNDGSWHLKVKGSAPVVIPVFASSVAADDGIPIGNGSEYDTKVMPDCTDTGGNHLNYTAATNTVSCGTSGGGAGAVNSRMYQESWGAFATSAVALTIQGNARAAVQVPSATTLTHLTITCVTGSGAAQAITCSADPCLLGELYVNGADKLSQDCAINTGTSSCSQALSTNNTITANQRINVRYTSASDAAPTGGDCIFALWGSLD